MRSPEERNVRVFRLWKKGDGRVAPGHNGDVLEVLVRALLEERSIDMDVGTGVQLVVAGLGAAGCHCRLSSRTVRRRFEKAGWSVSAFLKDARGLAANALFSQGWPTEWVARTLGYSGSSALRRFLRSAYGESVWVLRRSCEPIGGRGRRVAQSRLAFSKHGPKGDQTQTAST